MIDGPFPDIIPGMADATPVDTARYLRTERYVRDTLRIMGQVDDANNPMLVGRVAAKIMRSMDLNWAHTDSMLRLTDAELQKLDRKLPL